MWSESLNHSFGGLTRKEYFHEMCGTPVQSVTSYTERPDNCKGTGPLKFRYDSLPCLTFERRISYLKLSCFEFPTLDSLKKKKSYTRLFHMKNSI